MPRLTLVEVMPSGRERIMNTICDNVPRGTGGEGEGRGGSPTPSPTRHKVHHHGGRGNEEESSDTVPTVFQSNSHKVILTYSWRGPAAVEGGGEEKEEAGGSSPVEGGGGGKEAEGSGFNCTINFHTAPGK